MPVPLDPVVEAVGVVPTVTVPPSAELPVAAVRTAAVGVVPRVAVPPRTFVVLGMVVGVVPRLAIPPRVVPLVS